MGHSSACCSFPCCCWPLMKRRGLPRCAPRQTETFTGSSELLSISVLAPGCRSWKSLAIMGCRGGRIQSRFARRRQKTTYLHYKSSSNNAPDHRTNRMQCSERDRVTGGEGHIPFQWTAVYRGFVLCQNYMVRWLAVLFVQMIDLLDTSFAETAWPHPCPIPMR